MRIPLQSPPVSREDSPTDRLRRMRITRATVRPQRGPGDPKCDQCIQTSVHNQIMAGSATNDNFSIHRAITDCTGGKLKRKPCGRYLTNAQTLQLESDYHPMNYHFGTCTDC